MTKPTMYEKNLLLQKLYKLPLPTKEVDSMPQIRHAYFSQQSADQFGSVVWKTPEGKHVECTTVGTSEDGADYKYEDKKYVGKVVSYVSGAICTRVRP